MTVDLWNFGVAIILLRAGYPWNRLLLLVREGFQPAELPDRKGAPIRRFEAD